MGVKKRREAERRRRQRFRNTLIGLLAVAVVAAGVVYLINRDPAAPEGPGPVAGPSPSLTAAADGSLSFTVNSAKCGFDNVISADARIPAEGQFCEVAVTASNTGEDAVQVDPACQYLIGTSNERYPAHEEATRVAAGDEPFDDGIAPDASTDIAFQFDIPDAEGAMGVELHSSCDTDGVRLGLPAAES